MIKYYDNNFFMWICISFEKIYNKHMYWESWFNTRRSNIFFIKKKNQFEKILKLSIYKV